MSPTLTYTTSTRKVGYFKLKSDDVEVRRVIPIVELAGLTKALHEKSWEFVIHVKNDYDYRMESKE